jgi:hypothetical protein
MGLCPRGDLLHRPAVAVRVAEEDKPTLSSGSPGIGLSPSFCTSLTATPRSTSSARARWMSGTTSCRPFSEPGGMSGTAPVPITIEQADPGGVSCTTRT